MGRPAFVYLDTQVCAFLVSNEHRKLSGPAKHALERSPLRVSPAVLLELEILFELRRIAMNATQVVGKLEAQVGLTVCDLSFFSVIYAGFKEAWTRDPFDRLIVAHAKANGRAPLISADEKIRTHYPEALW